MATVTSLPGVTEQGDFELIGFTGHRVVLSAGEDRGLDVGRVIDVRALLQSELFERLNPRDRQLVIQLIAEQA